MPPIYQPEVAARGVVYAADHPRRKQYWVGASTVGTLLGQKLAPALLDRYLARTGYAVPADRRAGRPRTGRTTCGSRSTATTATTTARTGSSTTRRTARAPQLWVVPPRPTGLRRHRGGGRDRPRGGDPLAASAVNRFVAVRAGYGAILLLAPDRVSRWATGRSPDRTSRAVVRILGARHLAQAVMSIGASSRVVQALGVEVDALHSLSMLGLAALNPAHRRGGLIDAVAAGCFAAAGAFLTAGSPPDQALPDRPP